MVHICNSNVYIYIPYIPIYTYTLYTHTHILGEGVVVDPAADVQKGGLQGGVRDLHATQQICTRVYIRTFACIYINTLKHKQSLCTYVYIGGSWQIWWREWIKMDCKAV